MVRLFIAKPAHLNLSIFQAWELALVSYYFSGKLVSDSEVQMATLLIMVSQKYRVDGWYYKGEYLCACIPYASICLYCVSPN